VINRLMKIIAIKCYSLVTFEKLNFVGFSGKMCWNCWVDWADFCWIDSPRFSSSVRNLGECVLFMFVRVN